MILMMFVNVWTILIISDEFQITLGFFTYGTLEIIVGLLADYLKSWRSDYTYQALTTVESTVHHIVKKPPHLSETLRFLKLLRLPV